MWEEGSIYKDFIKTIGLGWSNDLIPITVPANKSLDRFQLAYLAKFNSHVEAFEGNKKNKLRGKIVEMLESFSSDDKIGLSRKETKEILEYFEKDNGRISNDFLGGAKLFSDTLPTATDGKVPELTVDQAIEISSNLWVAQQKLIQEWSLKKFFN